MARKVIRCEPRSRGQQRHVHPAAKADVPPDQPDRQEIKCEDMQIISGRTIEPADRRKNDESHCPASNGCLIPGALRARRIGHCAIKYRKRSAVNPSPQPTHSGIFDSSFGLRDSKFVRCALLFSSPSSSYPHCSFWAVVLPQRLRRWESRPMRRRAFMKLAVSR